MSGSVPGEPLRDDEPREDPREIDPSSGLRGRTIVPDPDPAWPLRPEGWRHDAPDPPDAFAVPFRIGDGFLLVLWSVVAQIVVLAPVQLLDVDLEQGAAFLVAVLLMQVLTLGGALAWLRSRGRLSWRLLGPVRPGRRDVLLGVGIGASGWMITTLLLLLATQVLGDFEPPQQELLERTTEGGLVTWLAIAVATLGAPIVEEVIYRGVLFQSLRYRAGLFPAMGISSFVWGLVHFQPAVYLVALAVFGFWLAAAFHRTGRLTVVVVAHATFNVIAVGLSFVVSAGS